jgi:uncharacterized protein (DUF1697 family)
LSDDFNPSRLITVFFRSSPTQQAIARLDEGTFDDVRFVVRGREMYVKYGEGMGTSKFVPAFYERRLGTSGTARNWNTVLKMHAFLQD